MTTHYSLRIVGLHYAANPTYRKEMDNLRIWLANLGNVVSEVCWSIDDDGYCVLITLKAANE